MAPDGNIQSQSNVASPVEEAGTIAQKIPLNLALSNPALPKFADVQFELPDGGVLNVTSPQNFTQEHWDIVCHDNNLFKGVRLDGSGPNPSTACLIAPLTISDIGYSLNDNSRMEFTTTYTERNSKYANRGWTKNALSLSVPWAPSSVDAEREELRARSYTAKTIYTSVYQRYPFITVGINQQSLKPSDEFQSAITDALAQAGDDMKTSALDRVFSIYGHVFQIEFDLGALMVKTSSTQTSSRMTQEKWEQAVNAELKAAIPLAQVAGVVDFKGGSHMGRSIDGAETKLDGGSQQTFELRGGNTRLSASAWIQTISDYKTWRIIKTSKVIPVVDILPDNLRKEIEAFIPKIHKPTKPLIGKWVEAVMHVTNDNDEIDAKWLKVYRAETGTSGDWFWLGQSLDKNKALMVKENQPGALGKIGTVNKVWDNRGSYIREKQSFWDFVPAEPEQYVSLGSYLQMKKFAKNVDQTPLLENDHLNGLRAVRKDLLVNATLGINTHWDNECSRARARVKMWEVVQAEKSTEDEGAIETHLFRAFEGTATRAEYTERSVYLIKKSAIEIIDGDYDVVEHNHTYVGESRNQAAGCWQGIWGRYWQDCLKVFR